jgi:hypothetical protein
LAAMDVAVRPAAGGWVCEVALEHGGEQSRHTVSVSESDVRRWGQGQGEAAVEDLVRRSFDFLLEREPPSSILRRFDLAVIGRYFPDYDQQLKP